MTTTKQLRNEDGQYAVGFDAVCKCGHAKGDHLAGAKGNSNGGCIVGDFCDETCDCEKFRLDRKAPRRESECEKEMRLRRQK